MPDHERGLAAHADEPVRLAVVDHDEGEVALEAPVHGTHGFEQVAVVDRLEEVGDDLGVRLGREDVAGGLELALQLAVVLDDPVQDDRELPVLAARERVRVVLVHPAVGRPAGVPDPCRRARAVRPGSLLQVLEVADGPHVLEPVLLEQRDPRRVVAPELEPLEARDQQVLRRAAPDVTDDPAHAWMLLPSPDVPPAGLRSYRLQTTPSMQKARPQSQLQAPFLAGANQPSSLSTSAAMVPQAFLA